MSTARHLFILFAVLLAVPVGTAQAELPKGRIQSLFQQAGETFRKANSTKNAAQADELYEKAILNYEKIIADGRLSNPKLYYNLANAYLLKNDIGRAILNYRRAEKLDKADANIHKNLAFARSKRIDRVAVKTEKRVMQTMFFWHYDFSLKTRFLVGCICFAVLCIALTVIVWLGRNAPCAVISVIAGIVLLSMLASVVVEAEQQAHNVCGVIVARQVIARQGDGQNYEPSFKEPLHAGTEFDALEQRPGWLHIRLSDGTNGWIMANAAELI